MLKIKNWARFQHFKDRKPPWIKLYRDLLDDLKWHELDAEAAKVLVMLWLIASEYDGSLPSLKDLAFRLRCSEKSIKSSISKLDHWLLQDDIGTISDNTLMSPRYQDDAISDIGVKALARSRETETETETEGEKERMRGNGKPDLKTLIDLGVNEQAAIDWLAVRKAKRAPLTATVIADLTREAAKAGIPISEAVLICARKSWQGFNAAWDWRSAADAGARHGRSTLEERNLAIARNWKPPKDEQL